MKKLVKNDKVGIVCLSRGLLGLPGCKHELDLAIKRLNDYGLVPVIMPNAMLPMDVLEQNPEMRASDLKSAFKDDSIKLIINAIGGNDTYKLIPYLMEDEEFKSLVKNHPKIFTGFSDTTHNHLLLNKLGLSTFYGPCLLVDIAELDKEMLPYTKMYFEMFFSGSGFEIKSSPVWYSDRLSYDVTMLNKPRIKHDEVHGYEVLNGDGVVRGKFYGGCLDVFYDIFTNEDIKSLYDKYDILTSDWSEKVLFLEPSDAKVSPLVFKQMLLEFKKRHIFDLVQGVLFGKPIDEVYYDEYKSVIREVFEDVSTPVMYNLNFGHSVPRCIIPYDAMVEVNFDDKKVIVLDNILD